MKRLIALVLPTLLLVASPAGANLITNPGFQDTDSNTYFGDQWGSWWNVGFWNFFPNGNSGHAVLYGDNNSNSGGLYQTGIAGTAGTTYQFSIDGSFESSWDAKVQFGLEFFQADDGTKISDSFVEIDETGRLGAGYFTYTMTAVAPTGTFYVRPVVKFDNVANAQGSQEAATFDNAVLVAVPEPATLGLLALAGAALIVRRR